MTGGTPKNSTRQHSTGPNTAESPESAARQSAGKSASKSASKKPSKKRSTKRPRSEAYAAYEKKYPRITETYEENGVIKKRRRRVPVAKKAKGKQLTPEEREAGRETRRRRGRRVKELKEKVLSGEVTWGWAKTEALREGHLSAEELKYAHRWKRVQGNYDNLGKQHAEARRKGQLEATRLEMAVKNVRDEDIPVMKPAPPDPNTDPLALALSLDELERAEALIAAATYKLQHKREFIDSEPFYDWQHDFMSSTTRQTMLLAGNRTGKTYTAGFVIACHLTQRYPDWWTPKTFRMDHPVVGIAAGVDNSQVRRVIQLQLFGEEVDRNFQGGWVHKDEIKSVTWNPAVPGLAQEVKINGRHGISNVSLRAYTQTRTGSGTLGFAGTSIDLAWVDECPPDELVGQLTVRTATGRRGDGGLIYYTMTPELGVTNLVHNFTEELGEDQTLIGPIAWSRCPHLTPEVIQSVLAGVPEHEREMREQGVPFFGHGLIYAIAEDRIICDPFPIPEHFRVIRAVDIGTRHPTTIAWLAYDSEQDIVYLVRDYAQRNMPAAVHAQAMLSQWKDSPIVFPPDVDTTEKGSGDTVRKWYERAGVKHSLTFRNPDNTRTVEPGVLELQTRMVEGRFKVFRGCNEFLRERRLYHRDEKGRIVKENDDVLDAVRYGVQSLRFARALGSSFRRRPTVKRAMARRGF